MPDGFINVLKPSFMTSSDVVVKVRGILKKHYGEKVKVGHLGTLDPGGAGVLPVAIGKGARLFPYTDESVKVYRAGFKFGVETDTLDSFGKVTKTCDKIPTKEEILTVLRAMKKEVPVFMGEETKISEKKQGINMLTENAMYVAT